MAYKYDVFISYSRRDYAIADKIVSALNSGGFSYFRDQQSLESGSDFLQSIVNAIDNCRMFLCVLSENAYSSEFVLKELEYALKREGNIVFPVIVDNSQLPARLKFSLSLQNIAYWQFNGRFNVEEILKDVRRALERNKGTLLEETQPNSLIKKEVDENPNASFRIFISYKRVDVEKVFSIKEAIENSTGENCWIDLDGIESDAQFANVIIKAINNAQIFLFMYSHAHSEIEDYDTDWTVREINFAQKKKKRIVFVNIDGSPLTDWFELMFGTKQQIDASSKILMEKLGKDLKKWLN